MGSGVLKVPVSPVTRSKLSFEVGSLVRLKLRLSGPPGRVKGIAGARVLVRWPSPLDYLGSHRAATLELETDEPPEKETACTAQQTSQ